MPELNLVDTNGAGGVAGQIRTPYWATLQQDYGYGDGNGYLEFGAGTPGSLPFRVDQAGNITGGAVANLRPSGDTTGAADSANVQALINSSAQVILGPGNWYLQGLTPKSFTRLRGHSRSATVVNTVSSYFMNAGASNTDSFEIDHLTINAPSAAAAHLFTGTNAHRWYIHDCTLTQNNPGFSIWNATTTTGQTMVECVFERNIHQVWGATRTAPAWFLSAATNSTQINNNVWRDEVIFNEQNDTSQYLWHIQHTGGLNQGQTFENIVCEHPFGGMIWIESGTMTRILGCYGYDLTGATISNPLIQISKNATGTASSRTLIEGGPRIQAGVTFGAGVGDINLDSNCAATTIIAPGASGTLTTYLGGSKGVRLVGTPDGGWGIQDSATTAVAGSAAGTTPPAPVVTAGPGNGGGLVTFGTGTGPAAGQQAVVTFGTPFQTTPNIIITAYNGASSSLGLTLAAPSATGFAVNATTAPAASQANTFYGFRWAIVES